MKEILGALKDMGQILTSSSHKMTSTMRDFSDNVQHQAATTEEISASVEELSAGVENVSKSAQEQNNSLNGLTNKLNGLSNVIIDMSQQIKDTMTNVNTISNQVKTGNESLTEMNDSMKKINTSSHEVSGIIQIINDISDQINLLSLNAAIEAARAGDAGRGFAVVADEISKLADKTATSIKDIDRLIKGNDSEIQRGMQNVESVVNMINTIVTGVTTISEQMNSIYQIMNDQLNRNELVTKDAKAVQTLSEQIKSATDEQKTAFEEIVKSITVINQLTQSNADGSEAISINSENVKEMAEELNRHIDFFKIGQTDIKEDI
jgi:methyl-accepting chemotaxis protein